MPYDAPIDDMLFTLEAVADYGEIAAMPGNEEFDASVAEAVLEEAARLARESLTPLNTVGDQQGAVLKDGKVVTPPGWHEAHQLLAEGGWVGLAKSPEFGGQGFPHTIAAAVSEIWLASNSAFALGNLLTQGAINAIELNGDEAQKQFWLPRLIDGTWAGTMNLTEPPAGSNLGAIKTMAKPEGDHYRISGQKIFITYGDHELTENIVHLVLARTPDAPAGTRGLSLFVVPKFVPNDDGSLGERNDITCVSLEHKMGIHGSPTAVLNYGDNGGAVGYLVGEEDRGLQYMFTMMNDARFEVGLQGLGIADGAYQHARAYAGDRKQGVPVGHATETTIDHHPDVRRMLMNMQARVVAMRCLGYFAASLRDRAHFSPDEAARTQADEEYNYLIPIVKGWMTETCQQVAYDGLQVHGGWGFIEEMGAAQFVRDARITTLYEGTTGIQAADLAFRKTAHDQGEVAQRLLERLSGIAATADDNGPALSAAVAAAKGYVDWLTQEAKAEPAQLAASSDTYLRAMGTLVGGALLERSAQVAREKRAGSSFADARTALARHFVASLLPEAQVQFETAAAAAGPVAEYDPAWL